MAEIQINNKVYSGNNIVISNGRVIIDGKDVTPDQIPSDVYQMMIEIIKKDDNGTPAKAAKTSEKVAVPKKGSATRDRMEECSAEAREAMREFLDRDEFFVEGTVSGTYRPARTWDLVEEDPKIYLRKTSVSDPCRGPSYEYKLVRNLPNFEEIGRKKRQAAVSSTQTTGSCGSSSSGGCSGSNNTGRC